MSTEEIAALFVLIVFLLILTRALELMARKDDKEM